jgi:hypothetical protein
MRVGRKWSFSPSNHLTFIESLFSSHFLGAASEVTCALIVLAGVTIPSAHGALLRPFEGVIPLDLQIPSSADEALARWLAGPTTECVQLFASKGRGAASLLKRVATRTGACRAGISGTGSILLRSFLDCSRKSLEALAAGTTLAEGLEALDSLMLAFFAQMLTAVASAWERAVSHCLASLVLVQLTAILLFSMDALRLTPFFIHLL